MSSVTEIRCKQACTEISNEDISSSWNLNPYRGCMHGCVYCFAIYSHDYLYESGNYYDDLYVKMNIAAQLEKQLSSPNWNGETIGICGVTDCYQPLEAKYKLMPDILRVLIKYKNPCSILTKSDLILRDYDLIDELSSVTHVSINASISCTDNEIRKKIEPGGKNAAEKFQMLKEFSKTNAKIGVLNMPIIPYITDDRVNIEQIYANASSSGVNYVMSKVLYLRGKTKEMFFETIKREFPQYYEPLKQLYQHSEATKAYKSSIYKMVKEIKRRYYFSKKQLANHTTPLPSHKLSKKRTESTKQLSLFDTNQKLNKLTQHPPQTASDHDSFVEIEMGSTKPISAPVSLSQKI